MNRDIAIVLFTFVVALLVGVLLFFYGGTYFEGSSQKNTSPNVSFTVLQEGLGAFAIDIPTNYQITNTNELAELWALVYGDSGPAIPNVDFEKQQVLAVFDGSHVTQGYSIGVTDILDQEGKRMVMITHYTPGQGCKPESSLSSPFQIILVPKTSLSLAHTDLSVEKECL